MWYVAKLVATIALVELLINFTNLKINQILFWFMF